MQQCQYTPGDSVMVVVHFPTGHAVPAVVRNVDLHMLRLKVVYEDGKEEWVYIERCYKAHERN